MRLRHQSSLSRERLFKCSAVECGHQVDISIIITIQDDDESTELCVFGGCIDFPLMVVA